MRSSPFELFALCCLALIAYPAPSWAGQANDPRADELTQQLASTDRQAVDRALDDIRALLASDPDQSIGYCRKDWIPALISASRFDLADHLAFEAIIAAPGQTAAVEAIQEMRVQTLLREDRPAQALSEARRLFNVASLRGTQHALSLIQKCMAAVHRDDNTVVMQFCREQIAGSTTRPLNQPEPTSAVMAHIPIDAGPYAAAISSFDGDDARSRLAKGNLLLLAGRCDEAIALFQAVDTPAGGQHRPPNTQNVARALKAADGNIGRANGYMLSQPGTQ